MKSVYLDGSVYIGGANGLFCKLSEHDLVMVECEGQGDITDLAILDARTIVCTAGNTRMNKGMLYFIDTNELTARSLATPERFFMLSHQETSVFLLGAGRVQEYDGRCFSASLESNNGISFLASIENLPLCGDDQGVLFFHRDNEWHRLFQIRA